MNGIFTVYFMLSSSSLPSLVLGTLSIFQNLNPDPEFSKCQLHIWTYTFTDKTETKEGINRTSQAANDTDKFSSWADAWGISRDSRSYPQPLGAPRVNSCSYIGFRFPEGPAEEERKTAKLCRVVSAGWWLHRCNYSSHLIILLLKNCILLPLVLSLHRGCCRSLGIWSWELEMGIELPHHSHSPPLCFSSRQPWEFAFPRETWQWSF